MTTAAVRVRTMRDDEFDAVRALQLDAFDGDQGIAALLDALRSSWAWIPELSLVAEVDGELCGHVLFSRALLDAPERLVDLLLLSPVGVRSDRHRQGIGTAMLTSALAHVVDHRSEPAVVLEGSPAFYGRVGFRPARTLGFHRPSLRIPEPAFQVFPLPSHRPEMTGTVVYPDAFWRTDSVGLRGGDPRLDQPG